tara:strand:- start:1092 stop:2132 length:1041 start_codon:yes stop_codon:yes gene_type:complete
MAYVPPAYQADTGTPPGGITINTAYVESFKAGFEQAFQQTTSKLQPYFEQESQNEEFQYFDRIGAAEAMAEDATRYGDNPNSDIVHDRRRIGLRDYELGKYIDEKDLKRVLTDPMNAYTQALLSSGKRKIDDIIIDKFFGPAFTGKSGATQIDFVKSAAEINNDLISVGAVSAGGITTNGKYAVIAGDKEGFSIGEEYVSKGASVSSGLTLDKLRAARHTMLRLEAITQDDTINCFLSAKQLDDLLRIDEVINSDYSVRKNLAEGNVTTFMGFRFIQTERLVADADGNRRVIISTPRSLKMSTGTSLKGDVWRVPAKKNIPYLYFKLCAEASRMWGEVSGEIRCAE